MTILTLREYQKEGVSFLKQPRGTALLADQQGLGKGQPLHARILTPTGWRLMGELNVGDAVIGKNGKSTTITGVYDRGVLQTYNVVFSDGSTITCDADHLWHVFTPNQRVWAKGGYRVLSTQDIINSGIRWEKGAHKHYIPMVDPIEFFEQNVPLDAYTIGLLLGDGGLRRQVRFTSADEELLKYITEIIPKSCSLRHIQGYDWRINGKELKNILRSLGMFGVFSHEKKIPEIYMYNTPAIRLAVLQGLMDTDGYVRAKDNNVEFSTTSEQLARDVQFIIQSLGGIARIREKPYSVYSYKGEKKTGRRVYRMSVRLPNGINPFRLERKASIYKAHTKYHPIRYIKSIEPAGHEEIRCISVDAPDSLYVTEHCIVTHNTVQTITAVKELGLQRVLILAPKAVLTSWRNEIEKWDSGAEAIIAYGTGAQKTEIVKQALIKIKNKRLYIITNWETLLQSTVPLANQPWDLIVADEAHRIKNRKAKRTKALKKLRASRRIALTGTPFDKHPDEMWSILNWLAPKRWSSYWRFYHTYLEYKETPWGKEIIGLRDNGRPLETDLQPWVLRRLKSDVLKELPPKQYQYIWTDLSPIQYEMYETLAKDFLAEYDGVFVDTSGILSRLTKFRQVVVSPSLLNESFPDESPRLDAIAEYVSDIDEPIVIFSNFVKSMYLLSDRIKYIQPKRKIWIYSGSTPQDERDRYIEQFQHGSNNDGIFLATIGAAGVGITLHRASTVIFIDRDWSPSNNEQAEDRVHRMGNRGKNPINVVIFGVGGTVDAHVLKLLDQKRQTFAKVLASDIIGKPNIPPKKRTKAHV